ncbi:Bacterial transcriptional regulator [compost metagenome]
MLPAERIEKAMAVALGDPEDRKAPLRAPKAKELREAVAELRDHGVTRAQGKPIPGVNAFSAPALDHEGKPAVVITALGHQDGFSADWSSSAATSVRQAAAEISSRLGWRKDHAPQGRQ